MRVTIWNENIHEQRQPEVRAIYPDGIHGCIRRFLEQDATLSIRTATFDEPEHGLSEEVLAETDVLVYWSHWMQDEFSDEVAQRIQKHVLRGMGLVALHSAHFSKMLRLLMGTTMTLRWRHGDRERLFVTAPAHPIAKGVPPYFELPVEEMYGEYFDIPKPDDVVFTGWFAGGEVFRSGCTFTRGLGKIFYFQPGHETCPTYHHPVIQQVIANAVKWCAPEQRKETDLSCVEIQPPLEADWERMRLSVFYEHIREAVQQSGETMLQVMKRCKGAGISGLEMEYATWVRERGQLQRVMEQAGLSVSCFYEFFSMADDAAGSLQHGKELILAAEALGVTRVMIIPGLLTEAEAAGLTAAGGDYEAVAGYMKACAPIGVMVRVLRELVAFAGERGVVVCMEDFDGVLSPINRMRPLRYFLEQVPGLGFTLDTGNFVFSEEDCEEAYRMLRPYVVHVHCKDRGEEDIYKGSTGHLKGLASVAVGDGYLPVRAIVNALKDHYSGYLAIEHFGAEHQLETILKSAAYLRSVIAGWER